MKFGAFDKVGIVVSDIDQAVSFFEQTLGWGPWGIERNKSFAPFRYFDTQSNCFVHSASFPAQGDQENAGRMPVELLQPVSGYSTLNDFYEKHGPGIQHVQITVEDMDIAVKQAEQGGCTAAFEGVEKLPMFGLNIKVTCLQNKEILEDTEIWLLQMEFLSSQK